MNKIIYASPDWTSWHFKTPESWTEQRFVEESNGAEETLRLSLRAINVRVVLRLIAKCFTTLSSLLVKFGEIE